MCACDHEILIEYLSNSAQEWCIIDLSSAVWEGVTLLGSAI